jgi:hypothetical protein
MLLGFDSMFMAFRVLFMAFPAMFTGFRAFVNGKIGTSPGNRVDTGKNQVVTSEKLGYRRPFQKNIQ